MTSFKKLTSVLLGGMCLLGVQLLSLPPASANSAQGYVAGAGAVIDDLSDESTLFANSNYSHSNYAAFWQLILYVELPDMSWSDVDCQFGPATAAFTREWQGRHGLPQTGQFDLKTRNEVVASNNFSYAGPSSDGDYWQYSSTFGTVLIHRHGANAANPYAWDVRNPRNTNEWHVTWYNSYNFSFCH